VLGVDGADDSMYLSSDGYLFIRTVSQVLGHIYSTTDIGSIRIITPQT
jgi:hypothetical protein